MVDRLTGSAAEQRVRDSFETAFRNGDGQCYAFVQVSNGEATSDVDPSRSNGDSSILKRLTHGKIQEIDGRPFRRIGFSSRLTCGDCQIEYPKPEPQLFSFNSPLGACPTCEGFGNLIDLDMDLIVPDPNKSLRDGAVAPWNTPAYEHELQELLALADDYKLPVDIPFRDLTDAQRELVMEGVPEREFGGLKGFFAWLERRKYKMHLRVFLSRWRSSRPCPDCHGARLRPEALAVRVADKNLAEISAMKIDEALQYFSELDLTESQRIIGRMMLDQVTSRLGYLSTVGVGYLTLDRPLKTLSGGEMQRVALTSALGSSLVNIALRTR